MIREGNAVRKKDGLCDFVSCLNEKCFAFQSGIGQLDKNMSFLVRRIVVAVYDAKCVVELDTVMEPMAASGKHSHPPAFFDFNAQAGRDADGFPAIQGKINGPSNIVTPAEPFVARTGSWI